MVSISSAKPKEDLVNYWKSHEQLCPHFNKFVEGEMYVVLVCVSNTKEFRPKTARLIQCSR